MNAIHKDRLVITPNGIERELVSTIPVPTSFAGLNHFMKTTCWADTQIRMQFLPKHDLDDQQPEDRYVNNDDNFVSSQDNHLVFTPDGAFVLAIAPWFKLSAFWQPTGVQNDPTCRVLFGNPEETRAGAAFARRRIPLPCMWALRYHSQQDSDYMRYANTPTCFHFTSEAIAQYIHEKEYTGAMDFNHEELQSLFAQPFKRIPLCNTDEAGGLCTGLRTEIGLRAEKGILRHAERCLRWLYCLDNNADLVGCHENDFAYLNWQEDLPQEDDPEDYTPNPEGIFPMLQTHDRTINTIRGLPSVSNSPTNINHLNDVLQALLLS